MACRGTAFTFFTVVFTTTLFSTRFNMFLLLVISVYSKLYTLRRCAPPFRFTLFLSYCDVSEVCSYSGRKITSLGNVTVRGRKDGKSRRRARLSTVCLSMYSITENIYYSQLSSVATLLQPESNCFTSYSTRK
jgi:hypothetical protein